MQATRSAWLDATLGAVSWLGFPPQSDVLFGAIVVFLFVFRERWGGICAAVAAVGSGGLYLLVEHVVGQPRPDADLVRVVGPIQATGFPSGHLATFTAVFGLLAYLGYCRLRPSGARWLPVALVLILLALMGFARIYAGHHWASDVFAGLFTGCLVAGSNHSALRPWQTQTLPLGIEQGGLQEIPRCGRRGQPHESINILRAPVRAAAGGLACRVSRSGTGQP